MTSKSAKPFTLLHHHHLQVSNKLAIFIFTARRGITSKRELKVANTPTLLNFWMMIKGGLYLTWTVTAFFTGNPKATAVLTRTVSPSSLLLLQRHHSIARSLEELKCESAFPVSPPGFMLQPNAVGVMDTGDGMKRKPHIEQPDVRKRQTAPILIALSGVSPHLAHHLPASGSAVIVKKPLSLSCGSSYS